MSTVPPQIQSTTNLGPSAPRPDWPLPVSLTITALLILILAIGLVTVSPQDWPLILRLSVGITYVASCVLLFPLYCLTNSSMTPLFLILAALPSLLATPCPCSDIYSYVHSSCYNTAPKPCTMNLGGGKSKSLLTVKVQKRGSYVSTCHEPDGRNICFYPTTHWGYSDGGGILDQNREKQQKQLIKNIISQLQATPEPYKRLDLLSQLRPLLKPPSGNQHLTRLLNSSFQFLQYTQHTSQCWICMSLSPAPHRAIP